MTREEIITALECCAEGKTEYCKKCTLKGYEGNCCAYLAKHAFELVRELTEENERLRAERDTLDILVKDFKFRLGEAMKANQTWEEENKDLECDNDMLRERITEIRADTVRGVQKRLKEYYSSSIYRPTQKHPTKHTMIEHLFYMIDQIAQEMIGETK